MNTANLVSTFALLACLAANATAQIPRGHLVVSNQFHWIGGGPEAGMFVINPWTQAITPIGDLPPQLNGSATPGALVRGPTCVALAETGHVVSFGFRNVGEDASLTYFTVQEDLDVDFVHEVPFGTFVGLAENTRGVPQIQPLAGVDGAVAAIVDTQAVQLPPFFGGSFLFIADPGGGFTGTTLDLLPIPLSSIPAGEPVGLAVSQEQGLAYIAMDTGTVSNIFKVPFPSGGTVELVATLTPAVASLQIDLDGTIVASAYGSDGLWRIDPITGTTSPIQGQVNSSAVAIHPDSGAYFSTVPSPQQRVDKLPRAGFSLAVSDPGYNAVYNELTGIAISAPCEDAALFGRHGLGCIGGSGERLHLGAENACPTIGGALELLVSEGSNAGIAIAFGIPVQPVDAFGCNVYIDPVYGFVSAQGGPTGSVFVQIPVLSTITPGFTATVQAFALDNTVPHGFTTSNAVGLQIQ